MRPGSRTDKLVWCPDIPTQRATLAETEAEQALVTANRELITREGNAAVAGKFKLAIEACRLPVVYVAMISLASGPAPHPKRIAFIGRRKDVCRWHDKWPASDNPRWTEPPPKAIAIGD